jgi:S1-C subfamily serine protease
MSPDQIYSTLSGGVVMVLAEFDSTGVDQFGQRQSGQALGTGFVVDDQGYILTNAHVVDENGQRASGVTVVFNKGGSETQRVPGQLVGVDVGSDVAVIKVDPAKADLSPLPIGDSDQVVVGEPVVAIGNPLGYDFSITSGIVSATGRSLEAPNGQTIPNGIQTDAAINQGNSGGPLIDGHGQVIGINEQIASSGGGNDGLGFAVPINTAMRSLEQIKTSGRVTYAWMGVSLQTLTSDIAGMFDVDSQGGALVEAVSPDSPAAKAGLRGGDQSVTVQGQPFTLGGDVIIKVDSTDIRTADDLIAYLGTKKPGDTVKVTVERDGRTEELSVTLAERPGNL